MKIEYDKYFWYDDRDKKSSVFQMLPDVYGDNRGSFSEVLKFIGTWDENKDYPLWFSSLDWLRQINRSKSVNGVIRGCHAQRGFFCQGKLVEAINRKIYDVITDARPNSGTFGVSRIFLLDPIKQNKLWVPRGFLHAFVVPHEVSEEQAIFNYYVDNSYNKASEICVNPKTVIPKVVEEMRKTYDNPEFKDLYDMFSKEEDMIYSDKDTNGIEYGTFMKNSLEEYERTGKVWYKQG